MLDISLDSVEDIVQDFSNSIKGQRKVPPVGKNVKFCWGIFLSGGGNLTRRDFEYSNFFQS